MNLIIEQQVTLILLYGLPSLFIVLSGNCILQISNIDPSSRKTFIVTFSDAELSSVVMQYKRVATTITIIKGVEIKLCYEVGKRTFISNRLVYSDVDVLLVQRRL